jgi:hypothetical protein
LSVKVRSAAGASTQGGATVSEPNSNAFHAQGELARVRDSRTEMAALPALHPATSRRCGAHVFGTLRALDKSGHAQARVDLSSGGTYEERWFDG